MYISKPWAKLVMTKGRVKSGSTVSLPFILQDLDNQQVLVKCTFVSNLGQALLGVIPSKYLG